MQSLVMGLGILVAILVSDVTLNNEFAYGLFFNTESGENETNDTLSIPGTETNDTLSIPGTKVNHTVMWGVLNLSMKIVQLFIEI